MPPDLVWRQLLAEGISVPEKGHVIPEKLVALENLAALEGVNMLVIIKI